MKHLVVVPEQANIVKYIYNLSFYKEFGSYKIATILNSDEKYRKMAPNDVWKSGTITSILTNPIYAGYTAYKRREHIDGKYIRLESKNWILAEKPNDAITIIDRELWQKVQKKRKDRGEKYKKSAKNENATVISRNDGMLALIDVAHCGYCGCKLTNGTKYDYWTIKATGERRTSRKAIYRCQNVWQGVPHEKMKLIHASKIEPIVFEALAEYIGKLQENKNVFEEILDNQNKEREQQKKILQQEKAELSKIRSNIDVLEDKIPQAITGEYPLSLEELVHIIEKQKRKEQEQTAQIAELEKELQNTSASITDWETLRTKIPTWREVFLKADTPDKRVLVNKLIERIDITENQVIIRFKINLDEFLPQPRITNNELVQKSGI